MKGGDISETSWLGEEACCPLRALLGPAVGPASTGARGAAGSGADLFLEADGGESGWFGVMVLSESVGPSSPRLVWVFSLEVSSTEACKKRGTSKHKQVCEDGRMTRIDQGIDHPTCELSGEGLRRFKVFLAATFLGVVLVLVGTRGADGLEVVGFLEADCGDIGCFCIMTFFRGG